MYVVTGATGNTGSVVANELLAKGQQVRVIGRKESRLRPLADKGAEPFVADLTDQEALRSAFSGAKAVYAMIPPDIGQPDVLAYQSYVRDSIAGALERAGVKYAVTLSSIGADRPEGTGPVVGLRRFEQRLNQISGLNVLHLRAGYFMENTLAQIGPVQALGIAAGPLDPNLKLPMIATGDIGVVAAGALLELKFTGQQTRELLGQRDLTMTETAEIIGNAIGFSKLEYRHFFAEQMRPTFIEMGMSPNMADLLLEMCDALNSGYMRALEPRSARNTTPTSYETFVAKEFVPRCQKRPSAA
ncbi:MAG: NAD(P)H-binding protein [Candidatus Korobacteraceae bacterium]|jgi:uncharacterized protein YbjT (DUF2867 family)